MTHERRKGEPAVRGGSALHKVYRRGYVIDNDNKREEGEVEVTGGASLAGRQEESAIFDVGDGADEVDDVLDAETQAVEERTIVQAETPPVHARTVLYSPDLLDDENPWA